MQVGESAGPRMIFNLEEELSYRQRKREKLGIRDQNWVWDTEREIDKEKLGRGRDKSFAKCKQEINYCALNKIVGYFWGLEQTLFDGNEMRNKLKVSDKILTEV